MPLASRHYNFPSENGKIKYFLLKEARLLNLDILNPSVHNKLMGGVEKRERSKPVSECGNIFNRTLYQNNIDSFHVIILIKFPKTEATFKIPFSTVKKAF